MDAGSELMLIDKFKLKRVLMLIEVPLHIFYIF